MEASDLISLLLFVMLWIVPWTILTALFAFVAGTIGGLGFRHVFFWWWWFGPFGLLLAAIVPEKPVRSTSRYRVRRRRHSRISRVRQKNARPRDYYPLQPVPPPELE